MLNPRFNLLPDYPFERLRGLLDPLEPAPGKTPIAMSLGEPQHPHPALVGERLAASAHLFGKYPPVRGTEAFRQAVADWLTRRYQLPEGFIRPDHNICPISGTREALFLTALLTVPPEKNGRRPLVLMPNPFYQCYAGAAVLAGAEPVYLPALPENGFLPDIAGLDADILGRTALVYFCSPANPQGAALDLAALQRLVTAARRHDFVLAMDECYAEIYTRTPPAGVLEACVALGGGPEQVLAFHSLSKRSNVPGLRSGFVAGDAALIRQFFRLREYGGAVPPLPVMEAATALWQEESHVVENRRLYDEKFSLAERILSNRFGVARPEGGFFLWLDVGDGEAAARRLWTEAAVRVLPGAYLTAPADGPDPGSRYIRIALVNDRETTEEALTRIAETL